MLLSKHLFRKVKYLWSLGILYCTIIQWIILDISLTECSAKRRSQRKQNLRFIGCINYWLMEQVSALKVLKNSSQKNTKVIIFNLVFSKVIWLWNLFYTYLCNLWETWSVTGFVFRGNNKWDDEWVGMEAMGIRA